MPVTTTTTSPAVLPDPTDEAGIAAVAPGRADDLIASLADQQIDDLIADGDTTRDADAEAAIDAAIDAASRLDDVATSLVASAAGELKAELDQLEAERAPTQTDVVAEAEPEAIAASAVEHALDSLPDPAPETAATPPSFNPPPRANLPETEVAPPPAPEPVAAAPEAVKAEESSADAVARELADDVALLSTPLPGVVEHAQQEAARDPAWMRMLAVLISIPGLILGAINLPVRPLSDRGREIVGAVGIVTLVNAAGLLIYLTMFAHRH